TRLLECIAAWTQRFARLSTLGVHSVLPRVVDFATSLPQNHTAGLLLFVTMGPLERLLYGTTRMRYLELDLDLEPSQQPAGTPQSGPGSERPRVGVRAVLAPVAARGAGTVVGGGDTMPGGNGRVVYSADDVAQLRENDIFHSLVGAARGKLTVSGFNKDMANFELHRRLSTPSNLSFNTEVDLVLNRIRNVFSHRANVESGGHQVPLEGEGYLGGAPGPRCSLLEQTLPHCSVSARARSRSLLHAMSASGVDLVWQPNVNEKVEDEGGRRTQRDVAYTKAVLEEDNRFSELNVMDVAELAFLLVTKLSLSSNALVHVLSAASLTKLYRDAHVRWLRALLRVSADLLQE
ncbi:unnamed protein product, partial [Amoebophrya sp. A25]